MPVFDGLPTRRARDGRYDLLMAIDHLLEGAQLYSKAAQDALGRSDANLAEYFGALERMSRNQAEAARRLLDDPPGIAAYRPASSTGLDQVR